MQHKYWMLFAAMLACVSFTPRAHACSACGCTLNSDWASQGLAASGGWRMDLRYDFFEQDQLRSGTDAVPRSAAATRPSLRATRNFPAHRIPASATCASSAAGPDSPRSAAAA